MTGFSPGPYEVTLPLKINEKFPSTIKSAFLEINVWVTSGGSGDTRCALCLLVHLYHFSYGKSDSSFPKYYNNGEKNSCSLGFGNCYQLASVMQQITMTFSSLKHSRLLFLNIFGFFGSWPTQLGLDGLGWPHISEVVGYMLSYASIPICSKMYIKYPLIFLYIGSYFCLIYFFFNVYAVRFTMYVVSHSDFIQ